MILVWVLSAMLIYQSVSYDKIITELYDIINNKKIEERSNEIYELKQDITEENQIEKTEVVSEKKKLEENNKIKNTKTENNIILKEIGVLNIPDIGLKNKKVYEGTDLEVLEIGIGHFTNTNIFEGNIGLASHNSGERGDEFKNLKNIKKGSKIYYETEYGRKVYSVKTKVEISDDDWSYLNTTNDNRITLLTCVSGKPNKRLCVQGIEI